MKRAVWNVVKARQAAVTDAASFAECAQSRTSTNVMFVNKSDVEAIKPKFDDKVEGCCGIPHIHKVHSVRSEGSYQVLYSLTSDEVGYRLSFRPTNSSLEVLPAVTEDAAAAGLTTAEHVTFANWVVVQFAGKKSSKYFDTEICTKVMYRPTQTPVIN